MFSLFGQRTSIFVHLILWHPTTCVIASPSEFNSFSKNLVPSLRKTLEHFCRRRCALKEISVEGDEKQTRHEHIDRPF